MAGGVIGINGSTGNQIKPKPTKPTPAEIALAKQRQMERDSINQNLLPSPAGPGLAPAPPAPSGDTSLADLVASMFGPQYDALNQQGNSLKHDAAAGDQKLKDMFANLVSSIKGDSKVYDDIYSGSLKDLNASTNQAHGAINKTYDSSAAKEAAILQRLGIQQAAPDVFQQGAEDRNFFSDLISSNSNAYRNQFNAGHDSNLAFNNQQANISRQTGVDDRAGLQSNLQKALADLASQRAGVQTSQAKQLADYQMSQQAAATKATQPNAAAASAAALKGPIGLLTTEAAKLYGSQSGAQNAVKAITDTLASESGLPKNVNDFIQDVMSRNAHATDRTELTDLASYLFDLLNGKNQY